MAPTIERPCWRCRADAGQALACPGCEAVQPLPAGADLFWTLGLPRRLAVDVEDLERRYHAASRAVHPDRHQTAGARERELSLAASAAVNRAYRTLRDPVARGRYWLELHGERLADGGPQVPPAIAAEVFETQEKLEELRAADGGAAAKRVRGEVRELLDGFRSRLARLRDELVAGYAAENGKGPPALAELRRRLAEVAYLCTLVGDIEETLGEGPRGTDHRH